VEVRQVTLRAERPSVVQFYFDPSCPWTWATSRWLVGAAEGLGVTVEWRSLSLAALYELDNVPARSRPGLGAAVAAHRVMAALGVDGQGRRIGAFYTEWGRRVHHDRTPPTVELVKETAWAAGAGGWASTAEDPAWDAAVKESTNEALGLVGPGVDSPVLAFDEPPVAVFGPIVSPPPSGREAADLFDLVVAAARTSCLHELRRGRPSGPQLGPRP
jgi:hypothetical protein